MARILAVDDNAIFLEMLCDVLKENDHEIFTASDGSAALDIFYNNTFDLIICDLVMPKMDGTVLIEEIKRNSPEMRIIAITGMSDMLPDAISKDTPEKLGVDKILDKPVSLQELLETVDKLLNSDTQ
jgi:two-component system response regulator SaeR